MRLALASWLFVVIPLVACSSNSAPAPAPASAGDTGGSVEDTVAEAAPIDAAPWLTYPDGPYGLRIGDVFPNFEFKGYKDGAGDWTDMRMQDYYDPDGSRGIFGIYFVVSAQWCPPCNQEADMLSKFWPGEYKARGARFVTGMIEDRLHKPATQTTVDQWVAQHKINFDIVLDDTSEALPKTSSVGLPYNYVINPRDMKVFKIIQGVDPAAKNVPLLNTLLRANGAPAAAPTGSDAATD